MTVTAEMLRNIAESIVIESESELDADSQQLAELTLVVWASSYAGVTREEIQQEVDRVKAEADQ